VVSDETTDDSDEQQHEQTNNFIRYFFLSTVKNKLRNLEKKMGAKASLFYYGTTGTPHASPAKTTRYVGCKFDDNSVNLLNQWLQSQEITNYVPPQDLHVTLISSSSSFPIADQKSLADTVALNTFVLQKHESIQIDPSTFKISVWTKKNPNDTDKCLVLQMRSDLLFQRFKLAEQCGAKSIWPDFVPHMTMSYSVPADYDISKLKVPSFPIRITHEFAD
jgi:hypothetical protein